MAISRIASQDNKSTTATTSISCTYPGATTSGNLLIATVWVNNATDGTAITNWTKATHESTANISGTQALFYKLADGTETTVTCSGGTSNGKMHIYEYTGNANPLVTDGINQATNAAATSLTSAAITTANANDLIFVSVATAGAITAPSATAPFNLRQVDATIRLMDADQIVAATGNYSAAFSWTGSSATANLIVGFQAASGAVSVSITQVAATVTATGGTQTVATINNVAITQLAGNVIATGGTQSIDTVNIVAISQVAATITATGGTQTIATINNASIAQIAGVITASGSTQAVATVNDVSIAQTVANIMAAGGTQIVSTQNGSTSINIAQTAAILNIIGGNQAFKTLDVIRLLKLSENTNLIFQKTTETLLFPSEKVTIPFSNKNTTLTLPLLNISVVLQKENESIKL